MRFTEAVKSRVKATSKMSTQADEQKTSDEDPLGQRPGVYSCHETHSHPHAFRQAYKSKCIPPHDLTDTI